MRDRTFSPATAPTLGRRCAVTMVGVFSVTLLAEVEGEPQLLEPEKCGGWRWCDPRELPEPHFDASRQSIACWLAGRCYLPAAHPDLS